MSVNLKLLQTVTEAASKPKELSAPVKTLLLLGAAVAGIIIAPVAIVGTTIYFAGLGIAGAINGLVHPGDSYDGVSPGEFAIIIKEMRQLQKDLETKKKKGKYYKLVGKYHGVDDFCDMTLRSGRKIVNIEQDFRNKKVVYPALSVVYYETDCVAIYKDLLKSMPNQDIAYYEGDNEQYLADIHETISKEMLKDLADLGFNSSKGGWNESSRYPHLTISYCSSGDGEWIWIYRKGQKQVRLLDAAT